MWWDASRIQATVTRQFVCSHLSPECAERLDQVVAYGGGGSTDGTYWECIDRKARRIFLILLDLGAPDHVFSIIDGAWDDNDLPLALDQVRRLGLTRLARDEQKFYSRQFYYLLKPLRRGHHTIYSESDIVPLDVVERRGGLTQGGSGGQTADKVTLPGFPNHVFFRRRIPLGSGPGCLAHEDLQSEADRVRSIYNEHIVSYFASYVHRGYGYVLFTLASDVSLKTMLAATPASVKALDKEARRLLLINWIHCLVDTLCYIHSRGLSHGNIRPSAVLLNSDNHIFFSDFMRLDGERLAGVPDQPRVSFDKEAYDFAAPEQWFRPGSSLGPSGAVVRKAALASTAGSGAAEAGEPDAFSISRGAYQGPPHLDAQAADVFSLGCVILELLGVLMKRPARAFAAHRAAKHKQAGRGGAVLDSSFHRNLGQVESWMTALGKEARKKDAPVLRGVTPMLRVVERMLALHPSERPSVHDVQTRMYWILTEACGIGEPHCVHAPYRAYSIGGDLKMASIRTGPRTGSADGGGRGNGDDNNNHNDNNKADEDADDVISIAMSKRSGGSSSGGGKDGQEALVPVGSAASSPPSPERRRAGQPAVGLASGLQAIRNLQIRDKARSRAAWQAPPPLAAVQQT